MFGFIMNFNLELIVNLLKYFVKQIMFDLMINLIMKSLAVIVYDLQLFDFDLYYSTKLKNSGYCSIFM